MWTYRAKSKQKGKQGKSGEGKRRTEIPEKQKTVSADVPEADSSPELPPLPLGPAQTLEIFDSAEARPLIGRAKLGSVWKPAMASPRSLFVSLLFLLVAAVAPLTVYGNSEGDALYALRRSLSDPENVLQSWDPNLVNPCTWFHVTCDLDGHVTRLDLGNSNLSGHLVPELGRLWHLQYLELYKNNIEGTIPPELGNLKNLISLDLYNNNLSGVIPPSLGKLKSLVFLRLNNNRLSGRIPRELADISTLKVVDVSNNNLCGPIPTTGSFEHIPLENFEKNPRLEGPELMGLASYDTNCY